MKARKYSNLHEHYANDFDLYIGPPIREEGFIRQDNDSEYYRLWKKHYSPRFNTEYYVRDDYTVDNNLTKEDALLYAEMQRIHISYIESNCPIKLKEK